MNKKLTKYDARPAGYRQKALMEMKARYPHYVFKSNLVGSLFLIGICLTFWQIYIYRSTFIPLYIPLSMWLGSGIIMTPIFKRTFNIYCFNPYSPGRVPLFFHFIFNIVAFGGIVIFLFMMTNQRFASTSKKTVSATIESHGHLAKGRRGCGEPYVRIQYQHLEKQIVFPCGAAVEKYGSIFMEIHKGFFGYDVIINKSLIAGSW